VLSLPPAFVLSQDQTLKFETARQMALLPSLVFSFQKIDESTLVSIDVSIEACTISTI
jgi:hypothetical protein